MTELGIRLRTMRDTRACRFDCFDVCVVNGNAVCEQWLSAEDAMSREILNRRDSGRVPFDAAPRESFGEGAASLAHENRLSFGFRRVHHQRQILYECKLRDQLKLRRAHGVRRVW